MTQGPVPDDDDRTVIRVATTLKPGEGGADSRFASSSGFMGHTLPEGTRLAGFEITGLIGEGGFGIVYLAYDAALERKVAIKEYMPSSLASRAASSFEVSVKSERHRETFEAGLKSFVNEARLLARFDHPALVKVFRFWEANRTAYMAMPYYEGPTLKSALAELGVPPPEALLREWLRPLLDALSVMHKEQCFHRDIAPDNILLTERGPLLLDFGAARRVIGDMTHALTVVLKPGYAPIEQYGEAASMTQGPWTDLYALASVVHYAITGRAPITSVERIMGDGLEPLAVTAAGRYSDGFLRAIDAALAVRPKDRPQDVQQFRDLLNVGLPPDSPDRFLSSGFQASGFHTSGFSASSFETASIEPTPAHTVPPTTRRQPVTVMPAMATRKEAPGATSAAKARPGFGPTAYVAAAFALVAVAALVLFMRGRADEAPAAASAPAASAPVVAGEPIASEPVAAAPVASAPVVTAAPLAEAASPTPAPTLAPAPAPLEPAAQPAQTAAPPPTEAVVTPVPTERQPDAVRAAPQPRRQARPAAVEPAPPKNAGVKPARCSDILQKASLEPLAEEEAAYLKRECR